LRWASASDSLKQPNAITTRYCQYHSVQSKGATIMIRPCTSADIPVIDSIINEAAAKYRGVIPADCWHEPYMSRRELEAEIAAGVRFSGWEEAGDLIGVMGVQNVKDATLIRHAYVRAAQQGRGIGGKLLQELASQIAGPLLIGTWADASWAIRFYQSHGFQLTSAEEKNRLLAAYWTISDRQRDTSVVLARR
jgi:N-acetylglutamate synthase-like GNAT family acetyltransferase